MRIATPSLLMQGRDSATVEDFVSDAVGYSADAVFAATDSTGHLTASGFSRLVNLLAEKGMLSASEVHLVARGYDGGDGVRYVDA